MSTVPTRRVMANKTRRNSHRSGATRHSNHGARPRPVASRVWSPVAYTHPESYAPVSVRATRNQVRKALAWTPAKASNRPLAAFSWGSWTLPPAFTMKGLKSASTCARRAIRREVLFATRSTGKGSHSPKRSYTNTRC